MAGESRFSEGGFESRFLIRRTDGQPCRSNARYMVLDGGWHPSTGIPNDPHARVALAAYANSVRAVNPTLAADLERMLGGDWPPELAQHADAK